MKRRVSNEEVVKIYELRDPRDLECSPRYVGITIKDLNSRLSAHVTIKALKTKTYKNNWIKSLLKDGIKPTIHLIEEVVGWDYACQVEKYYIKEFREQGYILTNSTDGGEGSVGVVPRQETRNKLSISSSGKNNPMYGKSGEDSPMWGRRHSEETIEKMRKSKLLRDSKREKPESFGITHDTKRNRWIVAIHVSGIKYSAGVYGKKEDAEKVIEEIYPRRYLTPPITGEEIRKIINKHVEIEWCRKTLVKPLQVNYKTESNQWIARISLGNGERRYLGIFDNEEDAKEKYIEGMLEIVTLKLKKYNINIDEI